MHHRTNGIRVHHNLCRRLVRVSRISHLSVQKLVNAILRDVADDFSPTRSLSARAANRRSWRRR